MYNFDALKDNGGKIIKICPCRYSTISERHNLHIDFCALRLPRVSNFDNLLYALRSFGKHMKLAPSSISIRAPIIA